MSDIVVDGTDGIVTAAVDRPLRANALRLDTLRELRVALETAEAESVRSMIVTGTHGRFSAGADVHELAGTEADLAFDDELESLTDAIVSSPVVVLAAVEGFCFGAAVDLAWACDAVVVADDARIALPATNVGLLYNPTALARLHARLGAPVLRRLVVVGEELTGAAVAASGAAAAVEPGTAATATAQMAARTGLVAATAATKAVLAALDAGDVELMRWQQPRLYLLSSVDRLEALRARRAELKGTT